MMKKLAFMLLVTGIIASTNVFACDNKGYHGLDEEDERVGSIVSSSYLGEDDDGLGLDSDK